MVKFNLYILPFSFLMAIILSGCSRDKILDEDKFVKVYTEIVIAHDTIPDGAANFDSVKSAIFRNNGITSGQYDSTVIYYSKDVKRWESFFNKATVYIDTLRSKDRK
jgi:Domain of unknown function (DUF4296)